MTSSSNIQAFRGQSPPNVRAEPRGAVLAAADHAAAHCSFLIGVLLGIHSLTCRTCTHSLLSCTPLRQYFLHTSRRCMPRTTGSVDLFRVRRASKFMLCFRIPHFSIIPLRRAHPLSEALSGVPAHSNPQIGLLSSFLTFLNLGSNLITGTLPTNSESSVVKGCYV